MAGRSKGLPAFEGQAVAGARLKLNGFGEDMHEALHLGDRRYFVVECEVADVAHTKDRKAGTQLRVHKAVILRTGEMDAREAQQLLEAEAERRAIERDEREGKATLPFPDGGKDGKRAAAGDDR